MRTRKQSFNSIIRSAQARAGFYDKTDELLRITCIPRTTFYTWLKTGDLPLSGLQRLDRVLHFTDAELGSLLRR